MVNTYIFDLNFSEILIWFPGDSPVDNVLFMCGDTSQLEEEMFELVHGSIEVKWDISELFSAPLEIDSHYLGFEDHGEFLLYLCHFKK